MPFMASGGRQFLESLPIYDFDCYRPSSQQCQALGFVSGVVTRTESDTYAIGGLELPSTNRWPGTAEHQRQRDAQPRRKRRKASRGSVLS